MVRVTIAPDYRPSFLNQAVWIKEHRTYGADRRIVFDSPHQVLQPIWQHFGVVIQEHQILAGSDGRALITCIDKAVVLLICDYPDAVLEIIENFKCFIG